MKIVTESNPESCFRNNNNHGLRTPNERFFFQMSQIFWPIGQISIHRYFRVFWVVLSAEILSLCIPSLWFFITKPFFLQIAKIFIPFTGFGIGTWIWAVENLGSSHHVSVVCDNSYYETAIYFTIGLDWNSIGYPLQR